MKYEYLCSITHFKEIENSLFVCLYFYFYLDNIVFTRINKSQISSFVIDITEDKEHLAAFKKDVNEIVFSKIFTMFINLQYLSFGPWSNLQGPSLFEMPYPNVISSNLLELHICQPFFTDLLYLLDRRFNQLHTFHVNTIYFLFTNSPIHSRVNYF